jgi:hypothetical protein
MTRLQRTAFLILAVVAWVAVSPAQPQQKDVAAGPDPYVPARAAGNLEVLSDTKGVDFGPYLSKFLQQIRKNWYNYIPEEARPPQLVSGKTSIEFAILPGGQIAGMKIVHPSGNVRLDRAAWGASQRAVPSTSYLAILREPFSPCGSTSTTIPANCRPTNSRIQGPRVYPPILKRPVELLRFGRFPFHSFRIESSAPLHRRTSHHL